MDEGRRLDPIPEEVISPETPAIYLRAFHFQDLLSCVGLEPHHRVVHALIDRLHR